MEDADNLARQAEEIEALSAIYGDAFKIESEAARIYSISIKENNIDAYLTVTLPEKYPSSSPPNYELSAPQLDRKTKEKLYENFAQVYEENRGETVIYQWIEKIREIIFSLNKKKIVKKEDSSSDIQDIFKSDIECPEISHGEIVVDRKSTFQGHAAIVKSIEEVKVVLDTLKENKKIANATHNMYAYRIERNVQNRVTLLQDCDDDGEDHAGGRLLHLLQLLDQKHTLVVVSRWYGGIQLGPDRFRHINNAARNALSIGGFIKSS